MELKEVIMMLLDEWCQESVLQQEKQVMRGAESDGWRRFARFADLFLKKIGRAARSVTDWHGVSTRQVVVTVAEELGDGGRGSANRHSCVTFPTRMARSHQIVPPGSFG